MIPGGGQPQRGGTSEPSLYGRLEFGRQKVVPGGGTAGEKAGWGWPDKESEAHRGEVSCPRSHSQSPPGIHLNLSELCIPLINLIVYTNDMFGDVKE